MNSKLAPKAETDQTEAQPEIPVSNPQPANAQITSYSMMEPKMRRIYGEFYREIYFSEHKHLDTKTQELISIAASLVAKCQGCIEGHLKKALEVGATKEEISETISIAAAINAASIIDLTDLAANNLNLDHFPSQGARFRVNDENK
jgi:AhpD family alkylhydroperoxidase